MKRSEMLQIIGNTIDSSDAIYMEDYGVSNNINSEELADEILKKLEACSNIEITHINPKFKGVSGKGDSWDYIYYCDNHPEHHYGYKNPRPEFYIDGWEPEDDDN